jgi:hypothetical protein
MRLLLVNGNIPDHLYTRSSTAHAVHVVYLRHDRRRRITKRR